MSGPGHQRGLLAGFHARHSHRTLEEPFASITGRDPIHPQAPSQAGSTTNMSIATARAAKVNADGDVATCVLGGMVARRVVTIAASIPEAAADNRGCS